MEFGRDTVEPHYLLIKPKILAEEYLENDVDFSSSLVDYKITVLNGKAHHVIVVSDRKEGFPVRLSVYDKDWNLRSDQPAGEHTIGEAGIPRPKCLEEMLRCAEQLAEGHPHVRVDMYVVHGKIKFGELTFTPQGGYIDYLTNDFILELGEQMILPSRYK